MIAVVQYIVIIITPYTITLGCYFFFTFLTAMFTVSLKCMIPCNFKSYIILVCLKEHNWQLYLPMAINAVILQFHNHK